MAFMTSSLVHIKFRKTAPLIETVINPGYVTRYEFPPPHNRVTTAWRPGFRPAVEFTEILRMASFEGRMPRQSMIGLTSARWAMSASGPKRTS